MRTLVRTSKWRLLTATALILTGTLFLSEAFARTKSGATAKAGRTSPARPDAPTPPSGTLSPANPTITYTDTLVENTTGVIGAPICLAPNTCSDFALTVNASSVSATKQILIEGTWTPAQNDFDIYIENTAGQVIAQNPSTANPSAIILPIPADGTVYHIFILASVGAGNLNGLVKLIDKTNPVNQGPGVPPRYMNYAAGPSQANDSGEPSLGVDWNPNVAALKHDLVNTGGMAMFTSNFNQWQASFDDCCSPALNPWTDVTDPNEQITSLDPIGFTDHYTTAQLGLTYPPPHTPGRTFFAQLAAGDSVTSYTDDDGATHTPTQGGGVPQGPDHETVGGGPFHSPIPTPPAPAYPNAIYYCTQSLTEAECSRSDNGGVSFAAGVPIYNPSVCLGGIHGHVKVSPQGTVYVPNSSCFTGSPGGNNGAAISKDNGITWNQFVVPNSTGSQDPSIGIGQNNVGKPAGQVPNTVYLGWISADGHAHVAHSPDEGTTWQNDIDVGSILGVQNAAFPAVVAGDDNRAAYGFIGTPTPGISAFSDDGSFGGVWHLYIATTYNGGQSWILIDATPFDAVQKGQICLKGTGCNGNTRNLLDFNDFTVDAQGRGLFGYADGCVNCDNNFDGQSHAAKGTIARQSGGRRLFAAFDPIEPAPPAAPQVLSAVRQGSPAGVLISWRTPDDGGSPIIGYKIHRSTSSGTESFLANVSGVDTNKYLDTSANSSTNYFYRVTAVNAIAEGPFCREVNVNGIAPAVTACLAPYIQIAGAGTFVAPLTSDPTQGEMTIQRVNIGEPFTACNDNSITFVMKVNTLDPNATGQPVVPPNGTWQITFKVKDTLNRDQTVFVDMDTQGTPPTPEFSYGREDTDATAGTVDTTLCSTNNPVGGCPAISGSFTKDGTITIKLNVSSAIHFNAPTGVTGAIFDWNASQPGTILSPPAPPSATGSTVLLIGAPGVGGGTQPVQTTNGSSYTRIGNINGCNTTPPLAILSANPLTGTAPLAVNFNGSASFEPFGACGTINSYTLDFGDGSPAVTQSSPLFAHTYTAAGDFPARLTVTNTLGIQSVNLAQAVITVTSSQVNLVSVVSRKTHGTAGVFDVDLPLAPSSPGIECRTGGANGDHTLRFAFDGNVTSLGTVSLTSIDGLATADPPSVVGGVVTVNLHNATNVQKLTVTLNNVNSIGHNASVVMGVLAGDTNANGRVSNADVSSIQAQVGAAVVQGNFRNDVNANGTLSNGDVAAAQAKVGTQLPP
jgi:hypothetical protein